MVTALSVEFGSISLATCIEAPVTSLISRIFDPPFPDENKDCQCVFLLSMSLECRFFFKFNFFKFSLFIYIPINDPHCEAGTINLNVIGGFGTVFGDTRFARS